jgi:GMP synthase (glutamine-hydrolysing)
MLSIRHAIARVGARCFSSASAKSSPVKLLVLDCYQKDIRTGFNTVGAMTAGALYTKMLQDSTRLQVETDVVYPYDKDGFMEGRELKDYDGVAWSGSSASATDSTVENQRQFDFMDQVFEFGLPQFGSCWGMQVAAVVTGGVVQLNPRGREFGISRNVYLTDEGKAHNMFSGGKRSVYSAFMSHSDEVTHMGPTGVILAGNSHSAIQAVDVPFKNGRFWGTQYHCEYTLYELARITAARKERLFNMKFFTRDPDYYKWIEDLQELHNDPSRKDLRWQLGVDDDLLLDHVRLAEPANWITHQVLPYKAHVKPGLQ